SADSAEHNFAKGHSGTGVQSRARSAVVCRSHDHAVFAYGKQVTLRVKCDVVDAEVQAVDFRVAVVGIRVNSTRNMNGYNRFIVATVAMRRRSEEHTSELQSRENLVCRLLLEKKNSNARAIWLHTTGRTS